VTLRSRPPALTLAALAAPLVLSQACSSNAPVLPKPPEPERPKVWRRDDGRCFEDEEVSCPPPDEATCNPPPPLEVACPPAGGALAWDAWRPSVGRREDGQCVTTTPPRCAPHAACEAGPEAVVPCPTGELAFDRYQPATAALRVMRDASGRCWEVVEDACPPDARCNPPGPAPAPCPDDPKLLVEDQLPAAPPGASVRPIGGGVCLMETEARCPEPKCEPGEPCVVATCNPPAPRRVRCPDGAGGPTPPPG
jgi:hypothetical protein